MTTKQIIRKIIFVALTLTACSGLVVLLVAAIGRRNHELCKDYVITMQGAQKNLFINEKDINKLLNSGLNGKIIGEPITDFNLRKLEQLIKKEMPGKIKSPLISRGVAYIGSGKRTRCEDLYNRGKILLHRQ